MSEKKSLGADEIITERRVGRRSAVGIMAAGAVTVAGAFSLLGTTACCGGGTVTTSCSDTDPSDPVGRGSHCGSSSGCSDTDPSDPVGNGSHC